MQKNSGFLINQIAGHIEPLVDSFSDERAESLEWFLKLEAIKAVNDENKAEFEDILKNNDMGKFAEFIAAYVPDIGVKITKFLEEN